MIIDNAEYLKDIQDDMPGHYDQWCNTEIIRGVMLRDLKLPLSSWPCWYWSNTSLGPSNELSNTTSWNTITIWHTEDFLYAQPANTPVKCVSGYPNHWSIKKEEFKLLFFLTSQRRLQCSFHKLVPRID